MATLGSHNCLEHFLYTFKLLNALLVVEPISMTQFKFSTCANMAFIASSLMTCAALAQDGYDRSQGSVQPTEQSSTLKNNLDTMKNQAVANFIASPQSITPLGLRNLWQTNIPHKSASPIIGMSLDDKEIFAWDQFGIVTRVKSDTGVVLWQGSTQSKLDKIFSVNMLPAGITSAAVALTDAATVAFEDSNGTLLTQESLRRVPATAGATSGDYVVFGDSEGRVIWMKLVESNITDVASKRTAAGDYDSNKKRGQRRSARCIEAFGAMSVGKVITPPVFVSGFGILTVSTGGEICLYDATNSKPIWKYKSNAPFVSKPSVSEGIAYVAGKDQSLHAIDLSSGLSKWDWFNQVALTNPPLAVGDMVVLQVPEQGLMAFSTAPGDKVNGLVMWKSKATGNAITRTKDGLITWDDASRTMSLVETKAGGITASAQFPSAKWVASTASMDGTIMLLCDDGRVQQLKPIEMMKPAVAPQTIPAVVKEVGADSNTDAPSTEPAKDDAPGAGESTP